MNNHILAKTYFTPYKDGITISSWDYEAVATRLPQNAKIGKDRRIKREDVSTDILLAVTHHVQGHCMDVAAVAVALHKLHVSRSVRRIFDAAGVTSKQVSDLVCLAGLIHDIGKFSWIFQNKITYNANGTWQNRGPKIASVMPNNPACRAQRDPDEVVKRYWGELPHAVASELLYHKFSGVPNADHECGRYFLKQLAAHHGWHPVGSPGDKSDDCSLSVRERADIKKREGPAVALDDPRRVNDAGKPIFAGFDSRGLS